MTALAGAWAVPVRVAAAACAIAAVAWGGPLARASGGDDAVDPDALPAVDGGVLYDATCASCHGTRGEGVDGRGPSLEREGEAAADFVLRTGRMPLPDIDLQPERSRPRFTEEQIEALVAHVGALGDGPPIPDVDPARGSTARGSELYRLNCAACHVASGAGSVIGGGRTAPSLMESTPTQVGEAVRVGPGAMPVFGTFTDADLDDLAAYVELLQEEGADDPSTLGGVGPVAEGLAAWLLGVLPLVALTRWIGSPHDDRPQPDTEDPA